MNKKRQNVIEINGSLYDATTGISLNQVTKDTSVTATPKAKQSTGVSVNGFIRSPTTRPQQAKKVQIQPATSSSTSAAQKSITPPKSTNVHRQPASSIGRKGKSSATLNRSGVKKPVVPVVNTAKVTMSPISSSASKQADMQRIERLQHIPRSERVSRFGSTTAANPTTVAKKDASAQSKSLTSHLTKTHHQPAATLSKKEQFIKNTLAKTAIHESKKAEAVKATKKLRAKKHSRVRAYATAGLVTLLITGYVSYLNIPSISMKVAANRAGFGASMPSYQPSGYSLSGPIAYSPGQVTVNFASNSDDRKFSLRQQPTTWDSDALLENYVSKQSKNYLTYQDQGLSIYIFDGTSAAWVNGQKMYIIDGNSSQLDTDQILKLATSI
ncbi:hypothetical protein KA021_00665 [Candidatus Saccharibacteria bacterium]|nr:hypothetical protein [Candidatus Saccharibacteria bacterium]